MKLRVGVGEDLDARIEVIEAQRTFRVEQTRSGIVLVFALLATVFLIGAAVIGVIEDGFGKLQTVWSVIAAPSGAVFLWYFGTRKPHTDGKEEGN